MQVAGAAGELQVLKLQGRTQRKTATNAKQLKTARPNEIFLAREREENGSICERPAPPLFTFPSLNRKKK